MKFSAKKLKDSFGFAWTGIASTFRTEQNLRIHCIISIAALTAAAVLEFSVWRYCVLLTVIASVISLELMNTAVENAVDLVTEEVHPLAEKAKDAAAGAVLVFSIFAVIIGILLFFQPAVEFIKQWNAGR